MLREASVSLVFPGLSSEFPRIGVHLSVPTVERLYCKRPIQCLASSKILTPPPPTARRVCTPRLWCGGRTHSLGGERGGGSIFWKTPGTVLYFTYLSTLWSQLYHWSQPKGRECNPPSLLSPPKPGSVMIWGAFAPLPLSPPHPPTSCEIADSQPNHTI